MALRSVVAFLVAAALPVAAGNAQPAETASGPTVRYVSDQLSINLRRGPGNEYRITELLRAGSRVEVMQETEQRGWSRVRTAGGEEGYVLTRFLSGTPAARERLAAAQRRAARLEDANAELKKELAEALDGSEELGRLKKDLVAENEALRNEVAEIREASANAVRISEENREFRQRLLALQSEIEQLRHENKALKSRREGMKVGALVLAAGILIGLILPWFRRRRHSSWDSL